MALDHVHYMDLAIGLSRDASLRGDRPLGSLLVSAEGEVIAQGGNEVYTAFDPTAHGEIVVIRSATRRLRTLDLSGCTLYTAMEPCPMCCWAILEAKVSRLVIGGRHAGIGRTDLGRYAVETMLEFTGRQLEIVTGVRTAECESMRLAWIAERATRGLGPR